MNKKVLIGINNKIQNVFRILAKIVSVAIVIIGSLTPILKNRKKIKRRTATITESNVVEIIMETYVFGRKSRFAFTKSFGRPLNKSPPIRRVEKSENNLLEIPTYRLGFFSFFSAIISVSFLILFNVSFSSSVKPELSNNE
jgi:hypothetical protein